MKKELITICFCFSGFLFAQQVSPQVISASGGTINNGSTNVAWVMGETVTASMSASSLQLTNGFLQPTYLVTAILENNKAFSIKLFPNPTRDVLMLEAKMESLRDITFKLSDLNGKELMKAQINTSNTPVNLSQLAPSTYWMSISDFNGQTIQTFKIIKQ